MSNVLIGRMARIPNIRLLAMELDMADEAKVIYNRVHKRGGQFPEFTGELLMGWAELHPKEAPN